MTMDPLPNPGRNETTRHMHWPANDWRRLPAVANARYPAGFGAIQAALLQLGNNQLDKVFRLPGLISGLSM